MFDQKVFFQTFPGQKFGQRFPRNVSQKVWPKGFPKRFPAKGLGKGFPGTVCKRFFSNPSKVFRKTFFLTLAKGLTKGFANVCGLWWVVGLLAVLLNPERQTYTHSRTPRAPCRIAISLCLSKSLNRLIQEK